MTLLKKSLILYGSILGMVIIFATGWLLGSNGNPDLEPNLSANPVNAQKQGKNIEYGKVTNKDEVPEYLLQDTNFNLFWQVWSKIQNEFIEQPVGETKLLYGSLRGLVASLDDPYSFFLEPQVAEEFTDELKGKFEGIGAEIGIRDERLTIIAPLPESPAEQAGLMGGDKVLAIDDFDTTGIHLADAVTRIRGEKGSEVILTIFRDGQEETQNISIIRDTIKIVSASIKFKDTSNKRKIGVIKLTNFNEDTGSLFRKAVNKGLSKGAEGFVLDVRNNPGGFLDKSAEIAGYWITRGETVVQESFANGNISLYKSRGSAELSGFPTVILINGGSASASEIVAGALQDYKLATIVGETSFGKGSVQDLEEFNDGSAVKLTIARWLTPNGRQIDENGIEPDEIIERTIDDINEGRDPQLDRALEILDEKLVN